MVINLGSLKYEQWLDFIFKHQVTSPFSGLRWYELEEWEYECDSVLIIEYLDRLFRNSADLLKKYSHDEIDQGLWFIPSLHGLTWIFLDYRLEWEKRRECIESMEYLFSDLFSKEKIGSSCYMWWDSVISYTAYENNNIETDILFLREIIAVMKKISKIDSYDVKQSIKHGIDHLHKIAFNTKNGKVKFLISNELGITKDLES